MQSDAVEGWAIGSVSKAFASANGAGNLIIAVVRMSTTSQTVTVTDTAGNVYTDAVSQKQTADGHQIHIFYAKNIVAAANTVTAQFSATNNHPWLSIYEYSGLSTTAPLDQVAHAEGYGATASSGTTPSTTSANELVFAASGQPASYAGTASAAYGYAEALKDTGTSRAISEVMTVNSTGSFAGDFGLNPGTNWTAVVATFKQ